MNKKPYTLYYPVPDTEMNKRKWEKFLEQYPEYKVYLDTEEGKL